MVSINLIPPAVKATANGKCEQEIEIPNLVPLYIDNRSGIEKPEIME